MTLKTPRISLSEEAETDADSAIDWNIGEIAFSAADDFINEIERALGLLKQHGRRRHTQGSLVSPPWFSLFPDYQLQADTIRVIAIAHHSSTPDTGRGDGDY